MCRDAGLAGRIDIAADCMTQSPTSLTPAHGQWQNDQGEHGLQIARYGAKTALNEARSGLPR